MKKSWWELYPSVHVGSHTRMSILDFDAVVEPDRQHYEQCEAGMCWTCYYTLLRAGDPQLAVNRRPCWVDPVPVIYQIRMYGSLPKTDGDGSATRSIADRVSRRAEEQLIELLVPNTESKNG